MKRIPLAATGLAMAATMVLGACGQKGPLLRPDSSPPSPVVIRPAPTPTVTPLPPANSPIPPQA